MYNALVRQLRQADRRAAWNTLQSAKPWMTPDVYQTCVRLHQRALSDDTALNDLRAILGIPVAELAVVENPTLVAEKVRITTEPFRDDATDVAPNPAPDPEEIRVTKNELASFILILGLAAAVAVFFIRVASNHSAEMDEKADTIISDAFLGQGITLTDQATLDALTDPHLETSVIMAPATVDGKLTECKVDIVRGSYKYQPVLADKYIASGCIPNPATFTGLDRVLLDAQTGDS